VSGERPGGGARNGRGARTPERAAAAGGGLRRGLANGLLALASLLLFFGLAEVLTRVVDLRPALGGARANPAWLGERWLLPRDDYRERLAEDGFLGRYYDLYAWDRWRFYRLRPEVEIELSDPLAPAEARDATRWSVRTSPQGWRGPPFAAEPAPGARRVVALGDSSTFGWGVEEFEAYPRRLEQALERGAGAGEWEVLNLGVPGYSTLQGRVALEREALPLSPDVITWSYVSNDGAMTGESDRAALARREGWLGALLAWLHRSRAYETLEAWIGRLRQASGGDAPAPAVRNVSGYAEAEQNVRAAVATARKAGVPLVLVTNCARGAPAAVLERVARETGTPHLDATALVEAAIPRIAADPAFASDRARLARRYGAPLLQRKPYLLGFLPDGCHPNAVGHRLIAEALAQEVETAGAAGASGEAQP